MQAQIERGLMKRESRHESHNKWHNFNRNIAQYCKNSVSLSSGQHQMIDPSQYSLDVRELRLVCSRLSFPQTKTARET